MPRNRNSYPKIWTRIIPGLAISLQLACDEVFKLSFMDAENKTVQCHGKNEFWWRTGTFIVCFLVGFFGMKKFGADRLYHGVVSFGIVAAWLFAISDFPLTCWINTNAPPSELQSQIVTILRLLIAAFANAIAAGAEWDQAQWILDFFMWIEGMLPIWMVGNGMQQEGNDDVGGDIEEETGAPIGNGDLNGGIEMPPTELASSTRAPRG